MNDVSTATRARRVMAVAVATAAAGTAFAWIAAPAGTPFAPGVALLAAAALLVVVTTSRLTAAIAAGAALLVLLRVFTSSAHLTDLTGAHGVAVAVGRWVQAGGLLVALGAATRVIARAGHRIEPAPMSAARAEPAGTDPATGDQALGDPARAARAHDRRARWAQVAALLVLCAICAEILQAYDDSTGRPGGVLFAIVFFAPLYGGPALVLRELARRTGRGWPSMLLMATAFAVIQPGVIDQALFSDSYRDIAGWDDSLRATYIDALGLSAFMSQSFVVGHVIYSFCAPIALVEAMRPSSARTPWVGLGGLALVATLYMAVAAAVLSDHLATESSHATTAQVVGTLVVAVALMVTALAIGRHDGAAQWQSRVLQPSRTPSIRTALLGGLVAATLHAMAPETWTGVAQAVVVLALGGGLLLRASFSPGWGLAHAAAVACGALLSRALLAFTYYPLIGEVSATRKYAHNVVMLALVTAVSGYAIRRARQPASPTVHAAVARAPDDPL
jgi:hypothetical protein